jgi:hypothetical protein
MATAQATKLTAPRCAHDSHDWERHPPQLRFRCRRCGVLGYPTAQRGGVRPYRCRDCGADASTRAWRGTVEVFYCDGCKR